MTLENYFLCLFSCAFTIINIWVCYIYTKEEILTVHLIIGALSMSMFYTIASGLLYNSFVITDKNLKIYTNAFITIETSYSLTGIQNLILENSYFMPYKWKVMYVLKVKFNNSTKTHWLMEPSRWSKKALQEIPLQKEYNIPCTIKSKIVLSVPFILNMVNVLCVVYMTAVFILKTVIYEP